jgi:hypothetical protein
MRRRRDVGGRFEEHALGNAAGVLGEPVGGAIGGIDVGRIGLFRILLCR